MEIKEQESELNSGDIESSEDISNKVEEDNSEESEAKDEENEEPLQDSKNKEKRTNRIANFIKKELKIVRHEFKIKKVHMCSRLKRKADKLRKKKSPPEIKAKNEKHADALIEELKSSNHISASKAAEFYMTHTKRDLLVILMNSRTTAPLDRFLAKTGTVFESVISRAIHFQSKFPNWKDILRIYFSKSSLKRTQFLANYENIGPDSVLEEENEENVENNTEKPKVKKNQKYRKGKNKRLKLKKKENKNKSDQISEDEMDAENIDVQNSEDELDAENIDAQNSEDEMDAESIEKIGTQNSDDSSGSDVSSDDEIPTLISDNPSPSTSKNSFNTKSKMSILVSESDVSDISDAESQESEFVGPYRVPEASLIKQPKTLCLPAEKYKNQKTTKRKISESKSEDNSLEVLQIERHEQYLEEPNVRLNRSARRKLAKLNNDGIIPLKKQTKTPDIPEPELKPDPFFMTKDDKDYLSRSSVKIPENVDVKQFNHKSKIPKPSTSFMNRPNFKKRNDDFSLDNFNPRFKPSNVEKVTESKFVSKIPPKSNFTKKPTSSFKNTGEKPHTLHPSWEAKKKKSGITEFKGSKIVFD